MRAKKRRKFTRPLGKRRYRKIFILAVEGRKTERQYFEVFNDQNVIIVKCLKGKQDSSPPQVLARMETHLKKEGLKEIEYSAFYGCISLKTLILSEGLETIG